MKVVVVGAGVIGLTTALTLRRELKCEVLVIAKEIPGDTDTIYTSTKAGAQWVMPKESERAKYSYPIYKELSEIPEAWIMKIPLYCGEIGSTSKTFVEPAEKSFADGYEYIGQDPVKFPGVSHIYKFNTFTISPPQYLMYLASLLLKEGVEIHRGVVRDLDAVKFKGEDPDYIVNSTGIQYNDLEGRNDPELRPIRGHTLLIENSLPYQVTFNEEDPAEEGEFLMVFPRKEGGSVLGGIYDSTSPRFDASIHQDFVERLQRKAEKHIPELKGKINILKHNIGFRPHRDSGARIEFDPQNPKLVHNYGCGSLGFIESWGCAKEVLELIRG